MAWGRRRELQPQVGDRGPFGGIYVNGLILLAAPSGRVRRRSTLVQDGAVRALLGNALAFVDRHSDLQEPHGGAECAMPANYSRESAPDGYPHQLWQRLANVDGPRSGRGLLDVHIRLTAASGRFLEVRRTIPECNIHDDMETMLLELPEEFTGLTDSTPDLRAAATEEIRRRLGPAPAAGPSQPWGPL